MLKRNWHYLLLLLLLADLGYSFWQYSLLPIDGDLADIVWPSPAYGRVMADPLGLQVLLHNEVYAAPNRFFAHKFLYEYFRRVPLLLQAVASPIASIYAACALLKTGIQALIIYLLAVYATNQKSIVSKDFLLVAVLLTPLFQTAGYGGQMGIVDISMTYAAFYALPVGLLLLFFLPFFRQAFHGGQPASGLLQHAGLLALALVLALNGPVAPATALVICAGALLYAWHRTYRQHPGLPLPARVWGGVRALPRRLLVPFGVFSALCLYSLFIGLNNAENEWATLPLAERYGRLPLGVYYMLTSKLGFPLLLLAGLVNAWLIRRLMPGASGQRILTVLKWLGIFSLVFVLLLPLGGYRSYREYIIRRDSILPIIVGLAGFFALSGHYLLTTLPPKARRIYAAGVVLVLAIFTVADKPRPREYNTCERAMLEKMAASPDPVVALDGGCNVLAWRRITDPQDSELQAQLLHYWGVTPAVKLYYQPAAAVGAGPTW